MLTPESLPPSMVIPTAAGEHVTDRTALAIADVFACVSALSDGAVLCPLSATATASRPGADHRRPRARRCCASRSRASRNRRSSARLVRALRARLASASSARSATPTAQIVQLEPLSPDRVVVQIIDGAPTYTYYSILGGVFEGLTIADVIHVRGMTAPDGVRGASPISLCREALGLAGNLTVSASATWANGAVPSGILTVPPGPAAEEQLGVLVRRVGGPPSGRDERAAGSPSCPVT